MCLYTHVTFQVIYPRDSHATARTDIFWLRNATFLCMCVFILINVWCSFLNVFTLQILLYFIFWYKSTDVTQSHLIPDQCCLALYMLEALRLHSHALWSPLIDQRPARELPPSQCSHLPGVPRDKSFVVCSQALDQCKLGGLSPLLNDPSDMAVIDPILAVRRGLPGFHGGQHHPDSITMYRPDYLLVPLLNSALSRTSSIQTQMLGEWLLAESDFLSLFVFQILGPSPKSGFSYQSLFRS